MSLPGVIFGEPKRTCQQCGAFSETRPYGPGGMRICYDCGQKDKEGTERRMAAYLLGEKTPPEEKK